MIGSVVINRRDAEVTAVGLAFDAGASREPAGASGTAHLLEHAVFRGCRRHPSHELIMRAAAQLGGWLEARTAHDITTITLAVPSEHAAGAIELLAGVCAEPLLDDDSVDAERLVVEQEIEQTAADPLLAADQLVRTALFGDHPLARPVLGSRDALDAVDAAVLRRFHARHWTRQACRVGVVGNGDCLTNAVVSAVVDTLPPGAALGEPPPSPVQAPRILVDEREEDRVHLRLAWPLPVDVGDARGRAALDTVATIVGGWLGSRLYDELRVARGLCYDVWASSCHHAGVSFMVAEIETGAANAAEAGARAADAVAHLAASGPKADELTDAVRIASGHALIVLQPAQDLLARALERAVVFGEPAGNGVAVLRTVGADDVRAVLDALPAPTVVAVGGCSVASLRAVLG